MVGQDTGSHNITGSEKEIGMTTGMGYTLATSGEHQFLRHYTTMRQQNAPEGLNAESSRPASARGGDISLDIPFYRTIGVKSKSFGDPNEKAHL